MFILEQYLRVIYSFCEGIMLLNSKRYVSLVVITYSFERAIVFIQCHKSVIDLEHCVFLRVVANCIMHILRDVYESNTRK